MSDWHVLPRCFAKMKRLGMVPLQILPRLGALSFIAREEAMRQTNHQNLGLPKVPLNHLSAGPNDLALKEDSDLVTGGKRGCSTSFGKLYERHKLRIQQVALRILGNQQDSEDAVQRAFQRAFKNLQKFREDSTFLTWLTRVAINEALLMLRRRPRNMVLPKNAAEEEKGAEPAEVPYLRPCPSPKPSRL